MANRNMVQVPSGTPQQQYQAPSMRLGRSQFDLSKNHKTTFDADDLIPYFVTEVVPGDTHTVKLQAFLRIFSPLDAPIMDNIHVSIDYFFVPNRLLWENWEAFLGAHDQAGAQDTDYTIPILPSGQTVALGWNAHYMGIPLGLETGSADVSALPFRAYSKIWDEWYRDQNLIDPTGVTIGDSGSGAGSGRFSTPLKSAKKPDYFTTALPYLQKGDAITLPLAGLANVVSESSTPSHEVTILTSAGAEFDLATDGATLQLGGSNASAAGLFADLSTVTSGVTINALREAAALQRLLERDARGGTRHPEIIRAHFGVDVPDMRTQRPEYLGGGSGYIHVSPVANATGVDAAQSPDGADKFQGNLSGIGHGTLGGSFAKSFVEHGYIIGLLRARGEVSYHQGLDRMWSRSTKYDFLWPELSQLGEQPIYNRELFVANTSTDDEVFGYQERYADYRFAKSLITGKFAPDASGALDFWHLAEDFASTPTLNQTFIESNTPMARIVAVADEPDFIIDGRFTHRVARALPVRPVPTLAPARF